MEQENLSERHAQQLTSIHKAHEALKKKYEQLESDKKFVDKELSQKVAEIKDCRLKLHESNIKSDELTVKLKEANAHLQKLYHQHEEDKALFLKLEGRIEQQVEVKVAEVRRKLDATLKDNVQLKTQADKLKHAFSQIKTDNSSVITELTDQLKSQDNLRDENKELRDKVDVLEAQIT